MQSSIAQLAQAIQHLELLMFSKMGEMILMASGKRGKSLKRENNNWILEIEVGDGAHRSSMTVDRYDHDCNVN